MTMKMNKVLVKLYVPMLGESYEVLIPINKKISGVIVLLVRFINEMTSVKYNPSNMPLIYDKLTAKRYDINLTVRESDIKNGTELILI